MKTAKSETATISIPTHLATRARRLSKDEGRTLSELFREAFRFYEFHQTGGRERLQKSSLRDWNTVRRSLNSLSREGKKKNLASFIIHDRSAH